MEKHVEYLIGATPPAIVTNDGSMATKKLTSD